MAGSYIPTIRSLPSTFTGKQGIFARGFTGDEPVVTSKTQACQGQTILHPSSIPSASGPPWCGQMLDVAKYFPSTLYTATSWPLSSTLTAVPGVTCSTVPAFTQLFAMDRSIKRAPGGVKKAGPRRPRLLHALELVDAARGIP